MLIAKRQNQGQRKIQGPPPKGTCNEVSTLTGLKVAQTAEVSDMIQGCPFRALSVMTGSYLEFRSLIQYLRY